MNDNRPSLLAQLDHSIALMAEMRTPDPVSTAAFDSLKQARALIAQALSKEVRPVASFPTADRAAA